MNFTSSTSPAAVDPPAAARWSRWIAMVMGLAMVMSLIVVTPAAAATLDATFTVDAWARDAQDETLADYAFTLTVDGCGGGAATECSVWIEARYVDEHTDQRQTTLESFDVRDHDQDGETRYQSAIGVQVAPTTSIRAHVVHGYGETVIIDVPISDSYQYPAPDPSAELVEFVRDPDDQTQASWQFDLDFEGMGSPGAPCWESNTRNNRCYYQVRLEHRSPADVTTQWAAADHVTTTDSATGHSPTLTVTGSGILAPVTHAVVEFYGFYGTHLGSQDNPYIVEIAISDSYQYPAPDPSAELVEFVRDPDDQTQASWQFDLDFEGMGSPGAPCWESNTRNNRCYYQVRLEHRSPADVTTQWAAADHVTTTDSATGHSPTLTVTGSGILAPVTHAVVEFYGFYGTHLGSQDNPYIVEIPVADPAAAIEHTEATGDEIEAAMGLADGEVPDEAVQAAITSMAMMDEAEILLALAAAPCPEINSSFNECMKLFSNMMAAGASKVTALSRVTRITGGAVIVAVAIGVVGAEELDELPPGEFPPPSEDPPKPVPPPGVGTFDPYTDPAPAAWVGTAEFDAAIEESRRVAEAVQVGVALLEDVCRQVLLGEIAAPQDVYDACQRFLVTPHTTLEDALRLLALAASDWEHHARIIDDLLAWATPLDYIEGEVAVNPFAPIQNPWAPSFRHELALTSCGLDNEALRDMIRIAQATNQWIRDHGGSVQLHRTTVTVNGKTRLNALGRQARTAREAWKIEYEERLGPMPDGYHASHLGDATVTGLPRTDYGGDGMERHRAEANTRIGGALGNRLQHGSGIVTVVTVDGQFVGTLDSPIDIERLC